MPVLAPAGSTSFVDPISLGMPLVAPIPQPSQTPMAVHLLGLGSVIPNAMLPVTVVRHTDGCTSPDRRVRWAWAVCRVAVPLAVHRAARGGAVHDGVAPVREAQVPRSLTGHCAPYPAVPARRRGHGDQRRADDFHAAGLANVALVIVSSRFFCYFFFWLIHGLVVAGVDGRGTVPQVPPAPRSAHVLYS